MSKNSQIDKTRQYFVSNNTMVYISSGSDTFINHNNFHKAIISSYSFFMMENRKMSFKLFKMDKILVEFWFFSMFSFYASLHITAVVDNKYFYDTIYHLSSEGAAIRTEQLINDINAQLSKENIDNEKHN